MSVQYEVTAITGKYTNKDGQEKSRYLKIGVVIQTKNGPMLKLEAVPVGWDGFAYLNEPKERDESTPARGNSSSGRRQAPADNVGRGMDDFPDDQIPFATNRGLY